MKTKDLGDMALSALVFSTLIAAGAAITVLVGGSVEVARETIFATLVSAGGVFGVVVLLYGLESFVNWLRNRREE